MKGFLFDENLPVNIQFLPSLPLEHVTDLGKSPSDTEVWAWFKKQKCPLQINPRIVMLSGVFGAKHPYGLG